MLVVLIGAGAIVIDLGALYQERRTLQNSADSAALALAKECSVSTGCPGTYADDAGTYVDANADDGKSDYTVCGSPEAGLPACDPSVTPVLPTGAEFVRVATSTRSADGSSTQVSFGLARALGFSGETVAASATVAWGGPGGLKSALPVTVSQCEYNYYDNLHGLVSGTTLDNLLKTPRVYPSFTDAILRLHFGNSSDVTGCALTSPGSDGPGAFGWLTPDATQTSASGSQTTASGCTTTSDITGLFPANTGNGQPPCNITSLINHVVLVPIFDSTNGLTGNNLGYYMGFYAAFYVTGFQYPSSGKAYYSTVPGSGCTSPNGKNSTSQITNSDTVICGYFVDDPTVLQNVGVGGPDTGITVIQMIQ